MRILHTSDWHVGRTMRGRSRVDEHRAVLREITSIARDRDVDIAIVAGDLFDLKAPTPESERIVYRALLDLAEAVPHVVVIAGNHDNAERLRAVKPLLQPLNIWCGDYPRAANDGGMVELVVRGVGARIALLPFVSQRQIVRAAELMALPGAEHIREYQGFVEAMLTDLAERFEPATVNIVVSHSTLVGAGPSGSEREAHLFGYYVPASVFPPQANYVALGHFHNAQQVFGPGLAWYSGSPLQLDFGEAGHDKHVLIVEVEPGRSAEVEQVRLESGRRLRNLHGSEAEILAQGKVAGDDFLKATITGPRRAGMADELRSELPNLVEITIAGANSNKRKRAESRAGRPYAELFAEYMEERGVADQRVQDLFVELLEDANAPSQT